MGDSKRAASDHYRRPGFFHAAPAIHNRHNPEQHDNRQERQLATDHLANLEAVQSGNLTSHQNRNTHRAKGDWRGIHDQAQPGRVQRVKAQTHQQRGGNGDRRAKACRPLKECSKGETDDQHLQTLVWGNGEY